MAWMAPTNPVHDVFHREFGIDSFALDGDATELADTWQDRRTNRR